MGSLNVASGELSQLPQKSDPALAIAMVTNAPVPCVAELSQDMQEIRDFLEEDFQAN
jgi:hypothetical protein